MKQNSNLNIRPLLVSSSLGLLFSMGWMASGCGSADSTAGIANTTSTTSDSNTSAESNSAGDANAAGSSSASGELKDSYSSDAPKQKPQLTEPKAGEEVAVITTKFGKIVFKFRTDLAPKTVENFKTLANKKFYDKTIFHRVIPDFMIQGGDPNTKNKDAVSTYGQGGPGYGLMAEFNDLSHDRGVVSMARSQDPNSAGSQFFVVVKASEFLDRQYTGFGEVVSGMQVADKIVNLPRNENDLPNERVEMTVRIEKWPVKK